MCPFKLQVWFCSTPFPYSTEGLRLVQVQLSSTTEYYLLPKLAEMRKKKNKHDSRKISVRSSAADREVRHSPKIFGRVILYTEEMVQYRWRFFINFLTGYSIYLYSFKKKKCSVLWSANFFCIWWWNKIILIIYASLTEKFYWGKNIYIYIWICSNTFLSGAWHMLQNAIQTTY